MPEMTPKQAVQDILYVIAEQNFELVSIVYALCCSDDPQFEYSEMPPELFCFMIIQTPTSTKVAKVYKTGSFSIQG